MTKEEFAKMKQELEAEYLVILKKTAKYESCFCYRKREGLWAYNYQILSQEERVDFF